MPSLETIANIEKISENKYKEGFVTDLEEDRPEKGLSENIIKFISEKKNEPKWMLDWRLWNNFISEPFSPY